MQRKRPPDARPGAADAHRDFFEWRGPVRDPVDVGSARVGLPVVYYDSDAFLGLFVVSAAAVRRVLPSNALFPVLVSEGRAVLTVAAYRHHHFSARTEDGGYALGTPYGEVAVAVLCTHGRPGPRLLPLLDPFTPLRFGLSACVLYLPVTSLQARDAGRQLFGLPKFVASMGFRERGTSRAVRVEEGGRHLLSLTVRSGGVGHTDHGATPLFGVRDGRLVRTRMPVRGPARARLGRGVAHLEVGDHPAADVLRSLLPTADGFGSRDYGRFQALLPPSEVLDASASHRADFVGRDVPHGRYTVAWDDHVTVDVYDELGIAGAPHRTAQASTARRPAGYVPEPLA